VRTQCQTENALAHPQMSRGCMSAASASARAAAQQQAAVLIKCPQCQRDISDTAHSCPGCGHVLGPAAAAKRATEPSQKTGGLGIWWALVVSTAAVVFLILALLIRYQILQFAPAANGG